MHIGCEILILISRNVHLVFHGSLCYYKNEHFTSTSYNSYTTANKLCTCAHGMHTTCESRVVPCISRIVNDVIVQAHYT